MLGYRHLARLRPQLAASAAVALAWAAAAGAQGSSAPLPLPTLARRVHGHAVHGRARDTAAHRRARQRRRVRHAAVGASEDPSHRRARRYRGAARHERRRRRRHLAPVRHAGHRHWACAARRPSLLRIDDDDLCRGARRRARAFGGTRGHRRGPARVGQRPPHEADHLRRRRPLVHSSRLTFERVPSGRRHAGIDRSEVRARCSKRTVESFASVPRHATRTTRVRPSATRRGTATSSRSNGTRPPARSTR